MSYEGIVPQNRPVIGKDMDEVRLALGLIVAEACSLFGLSMTRWMQHVRQGGELPIKDASLATLVRFYDAYPEMCPIQKAPAPTEMHEMLTAIRGSLTNAEFSAAFGAEGTAAYRWLKQNATPSPYAARLMTGLKRLLLSVPEWKRGETLDQWMAIISAEGVARGGTESPAKSGKWYTKQLMVMREAKAKELAGEMGAMQKRKKGLAAKSGN
jgi:hypothetical protein